MGLNLKQYVHPNAQNFQNAIMDCLTLFATGADYFTTLPLTSIKLTLPGRDTHLLRLEVLGLHWVESVKYLVLPNVAYPAYTKLAYSMMLALSWQYHSC